jgi:hypothetical protein
MLPFSLALAMFGVPLGLSLRSALVEVGRAQIGAHGTEQSDAGTRAVLWLASLLLEAASLRWTAPALFSIMPLAAALILLVVPFGVAWITVALVTADTASG